MAADATAPGGITHLDHTPDAVAAFLRPRPVAALYGVGPSTASLLSRHGLHTIGAVADTPLGTLQRLLGKTTGRQIHERSRGRDDRPVVPQAPARSCSADHAFPRDELDPARHRKYAQTMADLAAALGMPLGTFRNKKPHTQEGHPAPISSPDSRALLWDREQTAAFYAGKPVPALPDVDSDEDLLDRHEAAAELGVASASWNKYKSDPKLTEHVILVPAGDGGTEHWPRRVVRAFKASRPGRGAGGGRREGSGDMIPRDEILPRIAELLDDDPAITLAAVAETLGIAKFPTAQAGLAQVRGRRIADLLEATPHLTPQQAAEQLGYPTITHRGANVIAEAELRARQARPYLQQVADALAEAGIAEPVQIDVRRLADEYLAAAVPLGTEQTVPALVWDERYGCALRPVGAIRSARTPPAPRRARASATSATASHPSRPNCSRR
ncbi:hypothetical protein OHT93_36640 [Streptomyces sp. NBC_00191]|uniref:DNA polymerase thumb domain-containing protein n=1 Tax=Streptomyces sp. NBC_00191 TaxID=2975674 RepID=UPI00324C92AE